MNKMDNEDIMLVITIFGFFGMTGFDLVNATAKIINDLYFKLGNFLFWTILVLVFYLILKKK